MKIGVISDSHDNLPMIRKAVELFNGRDDVELVVHAGDFIAPFALEQLLRLRAPLRGVFGNNDGERAGLGKLLAELCEGPMTWHLGGREVCVSHSVEDARDAKADVMIYGHDHLADVRPGPPLRVNPGECCGYLTGRATVAVIDLDALTAEIIELP